MRRLSLIVGLLATALGCEFANEPVPGSPGDTSTDGTDGTDGGACPARFEATRNASLLVPSLRIDGLATIVSFDPDATYGGVPAACLSTDGDEAILQFEVAGEHGGSIEISGREVGTFDLGGTGNSFTIEVFDDEVPTGGRWLDSDWSAGVTEVSGLGDPFLVDVSNGLGLNGDGAQMQITVSVSIRP